VNTKALDNGCILHRLSYTLRQQLPSVFDTLCLLLQSGTVAAVSNTIWQQLQDVSNTLWQQLQDVSNTLWQQLQDVSNTHWQQLQDVSNTLWQQLQSVSNTL
jgi:predicted PurR-regulated permease PerM